MNNHPFDKFELISSVTGDLSDDKKRSLEEHLLECETCRKEVENLENQKSSFLSDMPFTEDMVEESQNNLVSFPTYQWKKIASVAAVMVVMVSVLLFRPALEPAQDMVSLKGKVGFQLFVEGEGGSIEERKEAVYFPGERIQISYSSGDKSFLMLFSMDSKGTVSRYFPVHGNRAMAIETGTNIPLPNSIRLDNYIGIERYFMVLSEKELLVSDIEKALKEEYQKNGLEKMNLSLGDGVEVISQTITKGEQ